MLSDTEYQKWWRELEELLDGGQGDLCKFWQHYASYLMRTGVHSDARKTLLQAAMSTASQFTPKP